MKCLGVARKICIVAGSADCETRLTAFDTALIKAGIHDYNLIQVSSIIAKNTEVEIGFKEEIEKGSFVPCVIARCEGNKKGEMLASVLGATKLKNGLGFVAELSEKNTPVEELKKRVLNKLRIAARNRNTEIVGEPKIIHAEHRVQKFGCAIAAAVYVF